MGEIDRQIAGLHEAFGSAEAQVLRTTIRAPIDGIVKKMRYNTLGGVVRAGEAIMEIVPVREELVIEAKLDPQDRGYVEVGQPAKIKISTYDFTRYGTLDGIVTLIGADADKNEDGAPYFRVVVQTAQQYLGSASTPLRISPGMGVRVQLIAATQASNLSAGVSYCNVFRGLSFNSRAILLSSTCENTERSVPFGI